MKKKIILLLLGLLIISGCGKVEELEDTEVTALLQPTQQTQVQEETREQYVTTQKETVSKPQNNSPTFNTDRVVIQTPSKEEEQVVTEPTVEVEENIPTVEELQEEEKSEQVLKAEEVLNLVRDSMPDNYRFEVIGEGYVGIGQASLNHFCDVDGKLRSDYYVTNNKGTSVTNYNVYYDGVNNKMHKYEDGFWNTEDLGMQYNIISSILSSIKDCRYSNSTSDTEYILTADANPITTGKDITLPAGEVTLYVDRQSNILKKVVYNCNESFLRANGYDSYSLKILFGEFGKVNVTIPQDATKEVVKVDTVSLIENMRNSITDNYTIGLRYDNSVVDLQMTAGNVLQTVEYTENGVPHSILSYFDAKLQKSFIVESTGSATGFVENTYTVAGRVKFFDLKDFITQFGAVQEVKPIWNTHTAFITTSPNLVINETYQIAGGKCAMHVKTEDANLQYIEFEEAAGSLEDRELNGSKRLMLISNINSTNVLLPEHLKIKFPEELGGY